ncbi:hypothetical protein [Thalassospira lucentensis]|uniref:hypothetical protein n=1 Tax=Thalassospira lucentensis TaxID=168935 RepID=UPI002943D8E5|nr:hypothetical protein [Thalassospira lucentensis]WOI13069.1 hypothetical protein R1T41_10825 [Thalassospira lucentensis]
MTLSQFFAIKHMPKWFHPDLFTDLIPTKHFAGCMTAYCGSIISLAILRYRTEQSDTAIPHYIAMDMAGDFAV